MIAQVWWKVFDLRPFPWNFPQQTLFKASNLYAKLKAYRLDENKNCLLYTSDAADE